MLLAPFSPVDASSRPHHAPRRAGSRQLPAWLLLWAGLGGLAVCLIPALRDNAWAGASLPFWLVGAPLLDMLWLKRSTWLAALGRRTVRMRR